MRLTGRVALVTGASRGIGRATALRARATAGLVERDGADVSGWFWRVAGGQAPVLTHDGRDADGQVST